MANQQRVAILKQGVEVWNRWREDNPQITPDLRDADFTGADLRGVNLSKAKLSGASFNEANLSEGNLGETNLVAADLSGADLSFVNLRYAMLSGTNLSFANLCGATLSYANINEADLSGADLSDVDLNGATLRSANLYGANLGKANLRDANLYEANLRRANLSYAKLCNAVLFGASLIDTNLSNADLTGSAIFGISAWDLNLENTIQKDLVVGKDSQSTITVDNLEVAQFMYLLLNNKKIRHVIDTITSKVVLILGRFTEERKQVLDAIRDELRNHGYLPVLFDFDKPSSRTTLETVTTLAGMARFVIADITDAKSVLIELTKIVSDKPSLPIQPIILSSQKEPGMFDFFHCYPWFLDLYEYQDPKELIDRIKESIIVPAETKWKELRGSSPKPSS